MSGSRIITEDDDLLDNVHPGAILREDFLIGSELAIDQIAQATGIPPARLEFLIAECERVDAAIDLRLARYLGISEGYFLGLQIDFDLEEERRTHGGELDRIVPRAA